MNNNIFVNNQQREFNSSRYINTPNQQYMNYYPNNEQTMKKYNPDIINNYKNLENKRKVEKFEVGKQTYKPIIKDLILENLNIKNQNDFKIKIENNNDDINKKLNLLSKEREYENKELDKIYNNKNKDIFEKKFIHRNANIHRISNIINEVPTNHTDRKETINNYYIDQNQELNKDKNRYNDIVDSLINEGLLD